MAQAMIGSGVRFKCIKRQDSVVGMIGDKVWGGRGVGCFLLELRLGRANQ